MIRIKEKRRNCAFFARSGDRRECSFGEIEFFVAVLFEKRKYCRSDLFGEIFRIIHVFIKFIDLFESSIEGAVTRVDVMLVEAFFSDKDDMLRFFEFKQCPNVELDDEPVAPPEAFAGWNLGCCCRSNRIKQLTEIGQCTFLILELLFFCALYTTHVYLSV